MAKITGIGGVFIFAQNTEHLAEWYERHLGFSFERMAEENQSPTFYQPRFYKSVDKPYKKIPLVFAIMPAQHKVNQLRNQAMINYRVDDLDEFIQQLANAGIATDPIQIWNDGEGSGKFTHLYDPEGNRIELWEHIDDT